MLHASLGTVTRIVESVAVRLHRGSRGACGVWINGKFNPEHTWCQSPDGFSTLSSAEINEYVNQREED
jgi:hypothetical protein